MTYILKYVNIHNELLGVDIVTHKIQGLFAKILKRLYFETTETERCMFNYDDMTPT